MAGFFLLAGSSARSRRPLGAPLQRGVKAHRGRRPANEAACAGTSARGQLATNQGSFPTGRSSTDSRPTHLETATLLSSPVPLSSRATALRLRQPYCIADASAILNRPRLRTADTRFERNRGRIWRRNLISSERSRAALACCARRCGSRSPNGSTMGASPKSCSIRMTLAFGDTSGGLRRFVQIFFGLSIAFAAPMERLPAGLMPIGREFATRNQLSRADLALPPCLAGGSVSKNGTKGRL